MNDPQEGSAKCLPTSSLDSGNGLAGRSQAGLRAHKDKKDVRSSRVLKLVQACRLWCELACAGIGC